MSARTQIGSVLRGAGLVIAVASLVYIAIRSFQSLSLLAVSFATPPFLAAIAIGMPSYALLCGLIAISWVALVQSADHDKKLRVREGLIIFGRSQILKYLPSNVLHLVGRYGMARSIGASHASLLFATSVETGLLILAASIVTFFFALPLFPKVEIAILANYWIAIAVVLSLIILTAASLYRWRKALLPSKMALSMAMALGLYICFFLLNALLLLALVASTKEIEIQRPLLILGVTAAAWLGGFLTPGAPAGLGVREVIMTSGLELAGCGSTALAAAVGYRAMTLGGDLIVALIGSAMHRPYPQHGCDAKKTPGVVCDSGSEAETE